MTRVTGGGRVTMMRGAKARLWSRWGHLETLSRRLHGKPLWCVSWCCWRIEWPGIHDRRM